MARTFARASTQYLTTASAPLTATPFSFSCWINTVDTTTFQHIMSIGDIGTSNNYFALIYLGSGSQNIRFDARAGGTVASAETTSGIPGANVWHHICALSLAANNRQVYIDGGNVGTNGTSRVPAGLDHLAVARLANSAAAANTFDGRIAEMAVWSTNITLAEVQGLAQGASPKLIEPGSLVYYDKMIRALDRDIVGGLALTSSGGPTVGVHTRMFYPTAPTFAHALAAAPAIRWTKRGGLHLQTDANWGVGLNHYFQADLRATMGTMYARLIKVSDGSEVANSVISTMSSTQVLVRSAALTLSNTENYAAQTGWIPGTDEGFGQTARIVHF